MIQIHEESACFGSIFEKSNVAKRGFGSPHPLIPLGRKKKNRGDSHYIRHSAGFGRHSAENRSITFWVIALTAGSHSSAVGHVIEPALKHPPPLEVSYSTISAPPPLP